MSQTSLRLRVVPRYPAKITATNGISAERSGTDVLIKSDYGSLAQVPSIANPDKSFFLAWDEDIDSYSAISLTNIISNIQDAVIGPTLAAIDAVNPGADQVVYFTGEGDAASYTASEFVRGVSNSPDAPSFLAALGGVSSVQVGAIFGNISIASAAAIPAGNQAIRTEVRSGASVQSGGGANYKRISFANLTGVPSQAYFRSQDRYMPDGSTDATNGGYWVLDEEQPSVSMFGAVAGDLAAPLLSAFQASIDFLPAGGGVVSIPTGDFSALNSASLNIGNKAVTWDCGGRAVTLPGTMKGIIQRAGVFSLPEGSIQANRNVRVHDMRDMGDILAVVGLRQYAIHVHGYLQDSGTSPPELEARAFSFDLGTNQNSIVDAIRGMKGRAYAEGGKSNVRAIYGFSESADGSGHSGYLTGLIGTIYKNSGNSNADGDSFAIRGHVDAGTTGAFQAAGAKVGETNNPSFGYTIRAGSGQPLLPTGACYMAHGGGAGDMYLGYRSNLDLTPIVRATNAGKMLQQSAYSGTATIADDVAIAITPPNTAGAVVLVWVENALGLFTLAFFRASGSHAILPVGNNGSLTDLSTAALSGTTGTDGRATISCNNGVLQIENRTGTSRQFSWQFFAR